MIEARVGFQFADEHSRIDVAEGGFHGGQTAKARTGHRVQSLLLGFGHSMRAFFSCRRQARGGQS